MDNFEEKLNAVLSSPEAMDKVMSMARSINGGGDTSGARADTAKLDAAPSEDILGALLGENGLDPNMLGKAMQLFSAYNKSDPQKVALLQAVKPYLRPARRARVDQAMQTLKLANVAKEALNTDILGNLLGGILGRK